MVRGFGSMSGLKIKFKVDWAGNKAGSILEVKDRQTQQIADNALGNGVAIEHIVKKKVKKDGKDA